MQYKRQLEPSEIEAQPAPPTPTIPPGTSEAPPAEETPDAKARYRRGVAVLWLASAAHAYSLSSVFSYIGFLAVDLGWVATYNDAGNVAGLLAAAMPLARAPTCFFWGTLADRIGSRRALTISMISVTVGNVLFPFCTTLALAAACRGILLGIGNGFITLMGPMAREIGGEKRQLQVLGFTFGGGTAMSVLAPAIAAYTYGALGTVEEFPYPALVPGLIGGAFGALTAILSACLLSDPPPTPPPDPSATVGRAVVRSTCAALSSSPLPMVTLLRSSIGGLLFLCMECFPLFAIGEAARGGMGLTQQQLGLALSIAPIGVVLWTSFLQAKWINWFGYRHAVVVTGLGGAVVLCSVVPSRVSLLSFVPLLWVLYSLVSASGAACMAISNNIVFVKHAEIKGSINGVQVMFESIAKGLFPMLTTPLMALALDRKATFSFWGGLACLWLLIHLLALALPTSVDAAKASGESGKSGLGDVQSSGRSEKSGQSNGQPEQQVVSATRDPDWSPKDVEMHEGKHLAEAHKFVGQLAEAHKFVGQLYSAVSQELLSLTDSLGFDKVRVEKPGKDYDTGPGWHRTDRVRILLDDEGRVVAVKQG
jgi:hypothetical protein